MSAVFFNSDVAGSTGLSNVHFAAFTRDGINLTKFTVITVKCLTGTITVQLIKKYSPF